MHRVSVVVGLVVMGLALVVTGGVSQEPKKSKGQLPPGWKKLDLSKEQILKIYIIQGEYKSKIKSLEEQLKSLRDKERSEMVKVLTSTQREMLRKLVLGEETKDTPIIGKDKKSK
jgi:hypothetical protein